MASDTKHLVLVKFKEEVAVSDLIAEMSKLVSSIDSVKSFEWGENAYGVEMPSEGFTHVFTLTFESEDDFAAYSSNPSHVEFSGKFAAAIDKIMLFHYPSVTAK